MVRNILAVVAGLVLGSIVNMLLVTVGPMVVAPPAGADLNTMEGLQAAMPLMGPQHFVFPFLAHALGTLVGAFAAARIAVSNGMMFALVIGGFFLLGGVAAAFMIPAPLWFIVLDLVVAYIPMAWVGGRIGARS